MPRISYHYWVGWTTPSAWKAAQYEIFKTRRSKNSRLASARFNTLGEAKTYLRDILRDEILKRRDQILGISKIRSDTVEDRSR